MSSADWIGFAIFFSGTVIAALTAYFNRGKPAEPDPAAIDKGQVRALVLTADDRALLLSLRDAMRVMSFADQDRRLLTEIRDAALAVRDVELQLGRRVDNCTDEMAELGRSIKDNTAAIERR